MPITFKYVGMTTGIRQPEIRRDLSGNLRLSIIYKIFESYDITLEELEQIKFICNSRSLSENDIITINNDFLTTVHVFTTVKEIRDKLLDVFIKNATNLNDSETQNIKPTQTISQNIFKSNYNNDTVDEELQKPIIDNEKEKTPELSEELILEMNKNTITLFEDKDFCNLIKIYYTKPELLKIFFNYVSHGDIINLSIAPVDKPTDYSVQINLLQSLGITDPVEKIQKALEMFNGQLNLALRVLLCDHAITIDQN